MVSKRAQARRRPRTAQKRRIRRGTATSRRGRSTRRGDVRNAGTEPSIARVVARGVKELVSSIPVMGNTLGSLADLAFKAFGLTQTDMTTAKPGQKLSIIATDVTRLYARFLIYPVALLVGSRVTLPSDTNRAITTPYCDGRVISLTVTIRPTNAVLQRQGEWHMSIQPYFNVTDEKYLTSPYKSAPYEEAMRRCYLSTSGPASQPLALTYRPRVQDGRAYQYNRLDTAFAEITILFTQYVRDNYAHFSAQEFAPEILVSGQVEMRAADPGGSYHSTADQPALGFTFTTMVRDLNAGGASYAIGYPKREADGDRWHTCMVGGPGYSEAVKEPEGDKHAQLNITGTVFLNSGSTPSFLPTLDGMALDSE